MSPSHTPLWKQLLGAATGMAVALALYGVYEVSAPHVQAYIFPQEVLEKDYRAAEKELSEDTKSRYERIASKTKSMIQRLEEQKERSEAEDDVAELLKKLREEDEEESLLESDAEEPWTGEEITNGDDAALTDSGVMLWVSVLLALGVACVVERKRLVEVLQRVKQ